MHHMIVHQSIYPSTSVIIVADLAFGQEMRLLSLDYLAIVANATHMGHD